MKETYIGTIHLVSMQNIPKNYYFLPILYKSISHVHYTNDRLLGIPSFCRITPQNKLVLIERFIYFAVNELGQTYDYVAKNDHDHKYLVKGWQKRLTLDKDIFKTVHFYQTYNIWHWVNCSC